MADEKIGFRSWLYLRVGYPIEESLIPRFGKEHGCGCVDLFGRRRRWCWDHATKWFDFED